MALAAAALFRPTPLSAAPAQGEQIHVTLSGEDLSVMDAPPIRADASFPLPRWSPEQALAELIAFPLGGSASDLGEYPMAVDAGGALRRGSSGTGVTGRAGGGIVRREAADPLPVVVEGAGAAAPAPAAPPTPEAAESTGAALRGSGGAGEAALPPATPDAATEPELAGPPTAEVPPAPHVSVGLGNLQSAGQAYSGATLELRFRPGHRLSAAGRVELRLPRLSAEGEIDLLLPDDLIPSTLDSAGGVLGRLRGSATLGSIGLSLTAAVLASQPPDQEESRAAELTVGLAWSAEKGSIAFLSELAGIAGGEPETRRMALRLGLAGGLRLHPLLALRADASATLSRAGSAAGSGYALVAAELLPPAIPVSFRLGVALTADGGGIGWLPVAGLDASLPAGWTLRLDAGPFAHTPDSLPWLLLQLSPPAAAPAPEQGFAARLHAEMDSGGAVALTTELGYADGLLWMLRQRMLEVAASRRIIGTLGVNVGLRGDACLRLELESAASWLYEGRPGVPDFTLRAVLRAGFWQAGLTGILFGLSEVSSAPGTAAPIDSVEALPGFQVAARLARSFAHGGSISAEARLLYHEEALTFAAEIGGSIGVR